MSNPSFDIVVARGKNGAISNKGEIPWRLNNDIKFFKELTTGCSLKKQNTVIMGKETWRSIKNRPLKERQNVVVSTTADLPDKDKCTVVSSLKEALTVPTNGKRFVIGGERLYNEAFESNGCNNLFITEVDYEGEYDRKFTPKEVIEVDTSFKQEENGLEYRFVHYKKPRTITYSKRCPLFIIDASYLVFYRYNATLQWFKHQREEIDYSTLPDDPEFVKAFIKHLTKDLLSPGGFKFGKARKRELIPKSNIVFMKDCSRSTIWRTEDCTTYKSTRVHAKTFNTEIFRVFYEFIESNNYQTVEVPLLEADDCAYLSGVAIDKGQQVYFITNDNDYLQMIGPNRFVFNQQGVNLESRSVGNPQKDLLIKIIMGDKSDNIPPVFRPCGKVTAERLATLEEKELMEFLKTKKGAIDAFHKNKSLIDMSLIPEKFKEIYNSVYHWVGV